MDVALQTDISTPANGTEELLIVRSRWNGQGAGRSDAYLTGGDLGVLTYTESECWGTSQMVAFFRNNLSLEAHGEEADCAFQEASFYER